MSSETCPTSYLPQLSSYEAADVESYIDRLSGYDRNATGLLAYTPDAVLLLDHEVDEVRTALLKWLPHQLKQAGITDAHNLEYSESIIELGSDGAKIGHKSYQIWGKLPTPQQVRSKGILLEVGGPTTHNPSELQVIGEARPDIVTNIAQSGEIGYTGSVDAYMDATNLAVPNKSIGALIASALPKTTEDTPVNNELRDKAIEEASRVLVPGGRLIWSGGMVHDLPKILMEGFTPEYIENDIIFTHNVMSHDIELGGMIFAGSFIKVEPGEAVAK